MVWKWLSWEVATTCTHIYVTTVCILADEVEENSLITVPAGRVKLGKPVDFPSYGWDCEYGEINIE